MSMTERFGQHRPWRIPMFREREGSSDLSHPHEGELHGPYPAPVAPRSTPPMPMIDVAVGGATGREKARRRSPRKIAVVVAAVAALTAGGWYGHHWWTVGRFIVSTDDAYVGADNTTLAAKVSGYLSSVPVQNNAHVRAGDVIATIDDGDYRLAVDSARDKAATQQASVDRIGRQIIAQGANVDQARAQMISAQANSKKMQLEFDRQQALAVQKFASQQTLEQAEANHDQAIAAVQSAQAAIDAAE